MVAVYITDNYVFNQSCTKTQLFLHNDSFIHYFFLNVGCVIFIYWCISLWLCVICLMIWVATFKCIYFQIQYRIFFKIWIFLKTLIRFTKWPSFILAWQWKFFSGSLYVRSLVKSSQKYFAEYWCTADRVPKARVSPSLSQFSDMKFLLLR